MIRPASHSGSWYSADPLTLAHQLQGWFAKAPETQIGARILIGPHAGYTYCGARLAETYNVWDLSKTKRVFILGPSHHVYFKDVALLSPYTSYETPFGAIEVDTDICDQLCREISGNVFKKMSCEVDDEEHLFEMHMPFLAHRCKQDGVQFPRIVPIMISALSSKAREKVVQSLLPFFSDEENTFVVLSDFCHWGKRFGYTKYVPDNDIAEIISILQAKNRETPIHESIEYLDRSAMVVASAGSVAKWDSYIETTGNTICGQKPIGVVLRLLEKFKDSGGLTVTNASFEWVGYSQSGKVVRPSDSSVSYASGFIRLS